jgi:hypothetical protein
LKGAGAPNDFYFPLTVFLYCTPNNPKMADDTYPREDDGAEEEEELDETV